MWVGWGATLNIVRASIPDAFKLLVFQTLKGRSSIIFASPFTEARLLNQLTSMSAKRIDRSTGSLRRR
jgi:hypothetical protein